MATIEYELDGKSFHTFESDENLIEACIARRSD